MYVDIVTSNAFNLNKNIFFSFVFFFLFFFRVFRVCGVRQNLYVFSLYRNPDQDDRIFYCLLTSMAGVQAEDSCLWVI